MVGLAYLVASYFAQGAFKETMQALFVLAFVLALRESTRAWREQPLRFVPAALIAVGSVYTYSFPGLIWLAAGGVWLDRDRGCATAERGGALARTGATGRAARGLRAVPRRSSSSVAPELGRMIDFHSFETFDPNGPGLGNLFGQVSPFEALGIWPSGDFRLAPGDGAVPAFGYYLGAAFASVLLLYGLVALLASARDGDRRRPAGGRRRLYAAARLGGTPYTAAKAMEIAAPLVGPRSSCCPLGCATARVGAPLPARRRRLLAARLRQRPGRPDLLLARADRAAPAGRRGSTLVLAPEAARRGTRHALHRLGAARRPGLHRTRRAPAGGSRRAASASSSPSDLACQPALRRPAPAPRRRSLPPLGNAAARPVARAPAR